MQQNDPLHQLYVEHYSYLYRFARSFVNPDLAEDLVQETFLIAQKRLDLSLIHIWNGVNAIPTAVRL